MGVVEELGCCLGQQDEKVYFVENKKNRIICWNLEVEEGEHIESCAKQLFGVTCAENAIWMYTQNEPNLYYRDNSGAECLYEGKHWSLDSFLVMDVDEKGESVTDSIDAKIYNDVNGIV